MAGLCKCYKKLLSDRSPLSTARYGDVYSHLDLMCWCDSDANSWKPKSKIKFDTLSEDRTCMWSVGVPVSPHSLIPALLSDW